MNVYIGCGRVRDKAWGKELELSISESDIDKLKDNLTNGWVTVAIKKRQEEKNGVTHYGSIFVKEDQPEATPADDDNLPW